MPQIAPGTWKTGLSFFWWREFADGRIEQEFDLDTGQIRPWGDTPPGLVKAGWVPVSPALAQKMRTCGEYGIPTVSPQILIALKPDEELEIWKDAEVKRGVQVHCKACGANFRSFGSPAGCPFCGAQKSWRCSKCDKIRTTPTCSDCTPGGGAGVQMIDPLESVPAEWDEVIYNLGIKGKFKMRFNSLGLIALH